MSESLKCQCDNPACKHSPGACQEFTDDVDFPELVENPICVLCGRTIQRQEIRKTAGLT